MLSSKQIQILELIKNRDEVLNRLMESYDVNYIGACELAVYFVNILVDTAMITEDEYDEVHVPINGQYLIIELKEYTNKIINRSIN